MAGSADWLLGSPSLSGLAEAERVRTGIGVDRAVASHCRQADGTQPLGQLPARLAVFEVEVQVDLLRIAESGQRGAATTACSKPSIGGLPSERATTTRRSGSSTTCDIPTRLDQKPAKDRGLKDWKMTRPMRPEKGRSGVASSAGSI